jgi:hypothetical protein
MAQQGVHVLAHIVVARAGKEVVGVLVVIGQGPLGYIVR